LSVVQDETTNHTNDCNYTRYIEDGQPGMPKSKSLGKAIMSSVFISEIDGVLMSLTKNSNGEPILSVEFLEFGGDTYWNSDRMLAQLRIVVKIRQELYPWARVIWRFDHSTNHKANADDTPKPHTMNINPGGVQPKQRDIGLVTDLCKLSGMKQQLTWPEDLPGTDPNYNYRGEAKGLKQVILERYGQEKVDGCYKAAKADDVKSHDAKYHMVQCLKNDLDFVYAPTLIHDLITGLVPDDKCRFYVKFHCELSPIQGNFRECKRYTRGYPCSNIDGLRRRVRQMIDAVCLDTIRRNFFHCRRWEQAARQGVPLMDRKIVVKQNRTITHYKSHRRISKKKPDESKINVTLKMEPNNQCYCSACITHRCENSDPALECVLTRCMKHQKNTNLQKIEHSVVPRCGYQTKEKKPRKITTQPAVPFTDQQQQSMNQPPQTTTQSSFCHHHHPTTRAKCS
jgi:hypothetical protein